MLKNIKEVLRRNCLRLYGHRYWQDGTALTQKMMDFQVNGRSPQGRSGINGDIVAEICRTDTSRSTWLRTDKNGGTPSSLS